LPVENNRVGSVIATTNGRRDSSSGISRSSNEVSVVRSLEGGIDVAAHRTIRLSETELEIESHIDNREIQLAKDYTERK